MPATDEQQIIINYKATPGSMVCVQAYAGSGKTYTLKSYAEAHPEMRILYLVFNKSIREEAQKKFPKNVDCKTSHALAAARFKHYSYKSKINIAVKEYKDLMGEEDWRVVKLAINGLTHFMNSADYEITIAHVLKDIGDPDKIPSSRIDAALRAARQVWKQQIDPKSDVPCTSNTLLKLFQMSNPSLDQVYDTILFDEAQDANPVTLNIVLNNKCSKIFGGDVHQAINRWRGAENALGIVEEKGATVMRLTKSFRFRPMVAALANIVLSMKGEIHPLVGLGPLDEVAQPEEIAQNGFHAVISRTYMGVIQSAYEAIIRGKRVMWNGGIGKYNLDELLDLHAMKTSNYQAIKNPRVLSDYGNWVNYQEIAETTKDINMIRAIRLIESYVDIPGMVDTMRANEALTEKEADLIVTTAHTSKGMEWNNVIMNNDYPSILEALIMKKPKQAIIDEMNLLYVAITRTQESININNALMELLEEYKQRRERNISIALL
ncbi:3'-5' exonuclease [Photorhabdus bodei]|uniref:DNA 3'-5' helicase n=1 Tax=Photorhabdus bodei TaxID=2029681 RepID=A0ABX0ASA3_9GAMM|nr:3'-5' exonuclease [Photorhabdus bodei]NDL01318.1 AAA family ATPase [Photorhabdus bodei]NDL05607.1 AAA family ATPase [Photorhabdus bodei]NDL09800.1 AAA family ATPase [Photorhabdus bodei]